ncbi:MAG: LPS export ABC transporter permease LptG [Paracoccaceae bacterium]
MTWTLGLYIASRFLRIAVAAFLAVISLVVVVDLVELLRANDEGQANFAELFGLALLRAPSVSITAAPFTVLLAAMACFAWLARSAELVVTRAAGVSAWRIVLPAILTATLLGIGAFAVYNPVTAALARRADALEERYFGRSSSSLSVAGGGIYLRQGTADGQTVIRARRASERVDRLEGVSLFLFGADDHQERRIEARAAVLGAGEWILTDARAWGIEAGGAGTGDALAASLPEDHAVLRLPTNLTPEQIQESFAPPRTIAFWDLPGFIDVLEQSGFSSLRHRMHWHVLLSAPLVFSAMVLVGAAFSMRHARFGGLGFMALGCVLTGFAYFFLADVTAALGASGAVPVILAAWGPPIAIMLFALALILHLEDG